MKEDDAGQARAAMCEGDRSCRILFERENVGLRSALSRLTVLHELSEALWDATLPQEIMKAAVSHSVRALDGAGGEVVLVDTTAEGAPVVARVASHASEEPLIGEPLLERVRTTQEPLVIDDSTEAERKSLGIVGTARSLLCVPLIVGSEPRGAIAVHGAGAPGAFATEDVDVLSVIARRSAYALENVRRRSEVRTCRLIQEEVRLASEIQLGLLPREAPAVEGWDIVGKSIPARVVGGDYFDFIPIDEHRLALCIGDVSGKGLPAAMLMANLQATIRANALLGFDPEVCLRHSNTLLSRATQATMFVTLFYGVLDLSAGKLCYANAGHNRPLLLASGAGSSLLWQGGLVLGFSERCSYEQAAIALDHGDLLLAYSDGITEATDEDGDEYGEEKLALLLSSRAWGSAEELVDAVLGDVARHTWEREQGDDMTILVVMRH